VDRSEGVPAPPPYLRVLNHLPKENGGGTIHYESPSPLPKGRPRYPNGPPIPPGDAESIERFIAAHCDTTDPAAQIPKGELFRDYQIFCLWLADLRPAVHTTFNRYMRAHFGSRTALSSHFWVGIRCHLVFAGPMYWYPNCLAYRGRTVFSSEKEAKALISRY